MGRSQRSRQRREVDQPGAAPRVTCRRTIFRAEGAEGTPRAPSGRIDQRVLLPRALPWAGQLRRFQRRRQTHHCFIERFLHRFIASSTRAGA